MRYLFIILLLCSACSPQRRLARLLRKHPELAVMDSTKIKVPIVIPPIHIDKDVATDSDTCKADSIVDAVLDKISPKDSSKPQVKKILKKELNKYLGSGTRLTKPIDFTEDNTNVLLIPDGNHLKIKIDRFASIRDTIIKAPTYKLQPKTGVSWWWVVISILLLLLIGFTIYKMFIEKAIK